MAAGGSGRLKLSGGRFDVTVILRLLVAWCYQTVGILKNQLLRKKSTNNTLIALFVCQALVNGNKGLFCSGCFAMQHNAMRASRQRGRSRGTEPAS